MAKEIATIQALDDKAVAAGNEKNKVINNFFNIFGNEYTNKRCPDKNEIVKAVVSTNLAKPILYGISYTSNQLIPIDDVSFYEYDNKNVNVVITNNGSKVIKKNSFSIDIYNGSGTNFTKIGSANIPTSELDNNSATTETVKTKARTDLLSNSGYFEINCRSGYGQLSNYSVEYGDDEGEHLGGSGVSTTSIQQFYDSYPLIYVGLTTGIKSTNPVQQDISIYITTEYNNNTNNYTEYGEITVEFYDSENTLLKTIYMPKTLSMNDATVNTEFKINKAKTNGKIVVSTDESHTINASFDYSDVVTNESNVTLNVNYSTYGHLYITAY